IFALVLYLAFLSGVIEGGLFPKFSIPEFSNPTSTDDLKGFFAGTYPQSGTDFAKLVFWSFVAGFSERFVPQIVSGVERRGSNGSSDGKKKKPTHKVYLLEPCFLNTHDPPFF